MSRIRTVKPALFKHEGLFDAEQETGLPLRLAFIGLFCQCDREGRFEWHPRTLKSDVLPLDEVDFSRVLDALVTRGFVVRYASGTREWGCIPTFKKHQNINFREVKSTIPAPPPELVENATNSQTAPDQQGAPRDDHASDTREARGHCNTSAGKGRGKEVNLKPKTKGSKEREGHNSRARAEDTPDDLSPTGPATITLAMRQASVRATPSNPRIIALAEAGVTANVVSDACEEAHRQHPGEVISANYVCTILERWQREPHTMNGRAVASVRASSVASFDERSRDRKNAFTELTGDRADDAIPDDVIDVEAKEVRHVAIPKH